VVEGRVGALGLVGGSGVVGVGEPLQLQEGAAQGLAVHLPRGREPEHLERPGSLLPLREDPAGLTAQRGPKGFSALRTGGHDAQTLKLSPQPQLLLALGLVNLKPRPIRLSSKSTSVPLR
jgi:hypothetical protein